MSHVKKKKIFLRTDVLQDSYLFQSTATIYPTIFQCSKSYSIEYYYKIAMYVKYSPRKSVITHIQKEQKLFALNKFLESKLNVTIGFTSKFRSKSY